MVFWYNKNMYDLLFIFIITWFLLVVLSIIGGFKAVKNKKTKVFSIGELYGKNAIILGILYIIFGTTSALYHMGMRIKGPLLYYIPSWIPPIDIFITTTNIIIVIDIMVIIIMILFLSAKNSNSTSNNSPANNTLEGPAKKTMEK